MHSINLLSLIAGLAAAVSWGLSDFFAARAAKRADPLLVTLFVLVIGAAAYTLLYAFGLSHHYAWNREAILLAGMSGLLLTIALTAFYRGLSIGPVSVVSPIGAAYPLVTALIVVAFLHVRLSPWQIGGIVLTVGGIMVTSGLLDAKNKEWRLGRGVIFAVTAFVLWGLMYVPLGKSVALMGWQKTTLIDVWFTAIGCLAILPFIDVRALIKPAGVRLATNGFVIGASLLQLSGEAAVNLGLTHSGSAAIVATLSACYPALTVVLALLVFKEKISRFTKAGIVVTILGVAVISYH